MEAAVVRKPIEKAQIKKIHALKNAMKMPDETYRKLLFEHYYPATSSKALTREQAEAFVNTLEEMAKALGVWIEHEGKLTHEKLGGRARMASPAQLRLIEALWKEVSRARGEKDRKKALRVWLLRTFKVSDIRFLDTETVKKVIHALLVMKERKMPETQESHSKPFFHDRSNRW